MTSLEHTAAGFAAGFAVALLLGYRYTTCVIAELRSQHQKHIDNAYRQGLDRGRALATPTTVTRL